MKKNIFPAWVMVYGPEEDAAAKAAEDAKVAAEAEAAAKAKLAAEGGGGGGGGGTGTLTQAQFNAALAEEKRKWQGQQKDLVGQLEQIKQTATLTQKQKDELQTQIESITAQYTTKEEQQRIEKEKTTKTWEKEKQTLSGEKDEWKGKYSKLYIEIEIAKASEKNGAYSSEQMIDYLSPRAKLAPELGEDNKPNGKFIPVITFHDLDKDKKPIILELGIADAIKRMKELPDRFGNFFKVEGTGGVGALNRGSGGGGASGGPDGFRKDMTHEEYLAYREKRKKAGTM